MRKFTKSLLLVVFGMCLFAPLARAQTANANASTDARRLLVYLSTLSQRPDHPIISGQSLGAIDDYVRDPGTKMSFGLNNYVERLSKESGKSVGLIGVNFARLGDCNVAAPPSPAPKSPFMNCDGSTPDYRKAVDLLADYWNKGGLVSVMWHAPNPWTGAGAHDLTIGGDFYALYTRGSPLYVTWRKMLDDLALGLQELKDRGVVVLFRPLHEQNGSWFWWGNHGTNGHPSAEEFVALWRDMFDYFTKEKHLDNLLWVFGPGRDGTPGRMLAYDPGAQYYDILGVSYYEDRIDKGLACADLQATHKPLALAEYGPIDAYAKNRETMGKFDFTRLFTVTRRCPGFTYFMAWTGNDKVPQALVLNMNSSTLLNDKHVLNLHDLNWRK